MLLVTKKLSVLFYSYLNTYYFINENETISCSNSPQLKRLIPIKLK